MLGDVSCPRILRPPQASFFLFGPRGTGKTHWLQASLPRASHFDLLDEATYQGFLGSPAAFGDELRALPANDDRFVVIDEIQRLPPLLNEVHRAIAKRGLRFALCGSSARQLRRAGVNLLAGRAVRRQMHPLLPAELGEDFDLEEALRFGTLPVITMAPDPPDSLVAYARMYLREEIQAEALVRNLPGFARFLPVAALMHAQTVNVSSLARDAGVARTTVQGYVEILEDTLIAYQLPAYEIRLRVRERRRPKLYFVDPGIPRALSGRLGPPGSDERDHLFEGWVAGVLRAYRDYAGLFDEWGYWSPAGARHTEVDFLLRRADSFVAVEAKSSGRLAPKTLKGLRAIAQLPGVSRRILVVPGGRRRVTEEGIEVLPADAFAAECHTGELTG